ncbi:MAG: acetolactate synthase, large subunit, biosynthetic type [Acidobacteria bacterium RIFCSPLOWO2_12_FULL_54_10]|nr:MAG: acetolactate synthase, large subunit, biosynthetic type [Acidobacteria bacterium RIFCSPLOWO2_12_FULL_54_10]
MPTTGAEIVLECLRKEGVEIVFGYPGGANIPLYDALFNSPIRHILTRHEQGATFAAQGYSRVSGRHGVCLATSGPGATNLVTGIADAKMDGIPLVCITGQVRRPVIGTDAFQETDVVGMTLPITKFNCVVMKTEELPRLIAQSFYIARSGRPGPVLIDIPVDVLKEKVDEWEYPEHVEVPGYLHQSKQTLQFDRLIEMLQASQRPVALVGAGAKWSGATKIVRELLDRMHVPTVQTVHGLGTIPEERPYYLGMVGMHGTKQANIAISHSDLLIVLGARLDDRVTGDPAHFAKHAKIVQFEIDPAQLDRVRPVELPIVGDLKETAEEFLSVIPPTLKNWNGWTEECKSVHNPPTKEKAGTGKPSPTKVLEMLFSMMDPDALVAADVGQHQMWAAQRASGIDHPRQFVTTGGLGTMGFALPATVGMQLAFPHRQVICVSGDGGFQMNIQELATIQRYSLPVKIMIIDNKYLGMVRQWQQLFWDRRYSEVDLYDNPDFVKIAEAYGITSKLMNTDADMEGQLKEFLSAPGAAQLVVECPAEANVYPMVPAGAALTDMLLEEKI